MGTVRRTQEQGRTRQSSRSSGRRNTSAARRQRTKTALGPAERRRLIQLVTCLVLFLAVFIGKGIFPAGMASVRESR